MKRIFHCILLLVSTSNAQVDTLRICTYNILNFPGNTAQNRLDDFRLIINEIDPDILVVQELLSETGSIMFLDSVMNYDGSEFLATPFINGPDTDNGVFYRSDLELLANNRLATSLRDIAEYQFKYNKVEFKIYSLHLKASQNSENENRRLAEVRVLKNNLKETNVLVMGDFNIYTSSEPAWTELTGDSTLLDPVSMPGNWHNNASFAAIHTQSTRTTQFGGGATGGLDDRFDLILVSRDIFNRTNKLRILSESYTAFGNDGAHFNQAINDGDDISQALHQASDHLPVYADFVIGSITTKVENLTATPTTFHLAQNYPNPFNPSTTIRFSIPKAAFVSLNIFNLQGQKVRTLVFEPLVKGNHKVQFDASRLPSGLYWYTLTTSGFQLSRKMALIR